MDTYDVVVLGGGVGGYTAAIQAAKHQLKVALVEASLLGGVCLNEGCIPTKTYLKSAAVLRTIKNAAEFGVEGRTSGADFTKIYQRKEKIVTQLRNGVQYLMKENKIQVVKGQGKLSGEHELTVTQNEATQILKFTNLIIATGAKPRTLANVPIDGKYVLTSKEMLEQTSLPKSIVIIGGGAIGLEWASLLNDLGVKVTVLEFTDHLLGNEAKIAGKLLRPQLEKQGITIETQAKVTSTTIENKQVKVHYQTDTAKIKTTNQILVAVGRTPDTKGLGLETVGIKTNDNGGIVVNDYLQTSATHIFAIGDCIPTLQLAHVAMAEGIHAADLIAGNTVEPIDYDQVPRCIYTYPELAVVGATNIDAKAHSNLKTGTFPYTANGKALIEGETTGEVRAVVDLDHDDVLQVLILGEHATDMIAEPTLGMYLDASATEIGDTIHPHPTLSEAVREAVLAAKGLATDI